MLGPPTILDLNKEQRSLFFSLKREKKMLDSKVVNRYAEVTPEMEMPCRSISIFLSSQKAHIFSRASQNGFTSRLLYQTRKSRNVRILLLAQTCWQYWYSSLDMFLFVRDE